MVDLSTPWHISRSRALSFLREKERWLLDRLDFRDRHARNDPPAFTEGCRVWYLGRSYLVHIRSAASNRLDFDGERFLFHCRSEEGFQTALNRFYLRSAKRHIGARVEMWSKRMGLFPASVRFRRYKNRWGCCAPDDTITFNTALMRYEEALVDYVVVHELAHIRHKHHQKAFWELVAQHIPDYRDLRKRLL